MFAAKRLPGLLACSLWALVASVHAAPQSRRERGLRYAFWCVCGSLVNLARLLLLVATSFMD
jgi:nitric oxide reductase large subunit